MEKLHLGVEIRDFDLERLGFSLSVLDETTARQTSEAYFRMTLAEMNAFMNALKAATETIDVSPFESIGRPKGPSSPSPGHDAAHALPYSLRR